MLDGEVGVDAVDPASSVPAVLVVTKELSRVRSPLDQMPPPFCSEVVVALPPIIRNLLSVKSSPFGRIVRIRKAGVPAALVIVVWVVGARSSPLMVTSSLS